MKINLTITGASDLAKRLEQLPAAVSRTVQVNALKDGAEIIRARASQLAPRSAGPGPHLADDIVIGTISAARLERQDRGNEVVVEVGPSLKPHDHFYGYFQEYGTIHHPAQPFMRPAFDTGAPTALNRILSSLWKAIRKALPTSFSGSTPTGFGSRAA